MQYSGWNSCQFGDCQITSLVSFVMTDQERIIPEPEPVPINTKSAGEMLSSARISWDLTIEDVALNLNLGTDTIRAIEDNDYDKLPGHTFIKGYIRSYAKLLQLDEAEVLDAMELEETVPDTIVKKMNPPPYSRSRTTTKRKKSGGGFWKWLFILMLLAGVGFYGMTKLETLDLEEFAELMKLPMLTEKEAANDGDSEISFPVKKDEDKPKEALIRIEE